MNTFKADVQEQYPDLANDIIETYDDTQPIVEVPHRTPMYVLPIILAILMAAVYVIVCHVQHKSLLMPHENRIGDIERKLMQVEGRIDKQDDNIWLLALLHNENFSAVRKATGIQDILFINRDWTIDRIPSHLLIPNEDANKIYKKFVKK